MSLTISASKVPSKSLYDTSVYINAMRSQTYYEQILPHFARSLPTTYFCAVVAQELKAGCYTSTASEQVEALLRPFRRTRRLVTPTFADWEAAGDLLARMFKQRADLKNKLPQLINDLLIALCGVRLGAVIYTANAEDFSFIQRYKPLRFEVV